MTVDNNGTSHRHISTIHENTGINHVFKYDIHAGEQGVFDFRKVNELKNGDTVSLPKAWCDKVNADSPKVPNQSCLCDLKGWKY